MNKNSVYRPGIETGNVYGVFAMFYLVIKRSSESDFPIDLLKNYERKADYDVECGKNTDRTSNYHK